MYKIIHITFAKLVWDCSRVSKCLKARFQIMNMATNEFTHWFRLKRITYTNLGRHLLSSCD